jgi:TolA-binding protein
MTCERYPDPIDAERYVSGDMTEPEQTTFEEHFFTCDVCFERVRELQRVQVALRAGASAQPARRRSLVWVAGLSAAAVLAIAVGAWQWSSRTTEPVESAQAGSTASSSPPGANGVASRANARQAALSALALVTPPSYTPMTTRGKESAARRQFDDAMVNYVAGRYADAEAGLSAAVTSAPKFAPAQFYLGVSRLLLGHPAAARPALAAAASLAVSPWSDESHFYLAKAALAQDDVETATTELRAAAAAGAGPAGEATRLLAALGELPR